MKKIIAGILVLVMLLCMFSCGKKNETEPENNNVDISEENTITESDELIAEYTQEEWEERYPGENVCPFIIEVGGIEYNYYHISGFDDGTMRSWIGAPTNWNGWHLVGEDIVNKDETYKMTDNWGAEEPEDHISSWCVVTTEPYSK